MRTKAYLSKYFYILFLFCSSQLYGQNSYSKNSLIIPVAKFVEWPSSKINDGNFTFGLGYGRKINSRIEIRLLGYKRYGNYVKGGPSVFTGKINKSVIKFGSKYDLLRRSKIVYGAGINYVFEHSKIKDGRYISDGGNFDIIKWSTQNHLNAIEIFNEIDIKIYKPLWLYANFSFQFGKEKNNDNLLGTFYRSLGKFTLIESIGLKLTI